jgi:hypothetical protein
LTFGRESRFFKQINAIIHLFLPQIIEKEKTNMLSYPSAFKSYKDFIKFAFFFFLAFEEYFINEKKNT